MTTYDGPGRGRKQCSSCNEYVHVRQKICDCGQAFQQNQPAQPKLGKTVKKHKKEEEKVSTLTDKDREYILAIGVTTINKFIRIPAGKCPVPLRGHSDGHVRIWFDAVIDHCFNGDVYSLEAVKYFVREFYSYNTADYKLVCETIDRYVKELGESYVFEGSVEIAD